MNLNTNYATALQGLHLLLLDSKYVIMCRLLASELNQSHKDLEFQASPEYSKVYFFDLNKEVLYVGHRHRTFSLNETQLVSSRT